MTRVLVTGANGFVGRHLCFVLAREGVEVIPVFRTKEQKKVAWNSQFNFSIVKDISPSSDWSVNFKKVDVVVHLAARVHKFSEHSDENESEYFKSNTFSTLKLAKQAAQFGVKRFIFLSTVKVHGEFNVKDKPFCISDELSPKGPYGISKYEAEIELRKLENNSDMEVVIIRPPLVYGPGVKANFLTLMSLVNKGIPLPLGKIENKRSLISTDNLIDFIVTCIDHPSAAGRSFLVSDGEDISTTELLCLLADCMNKKIRLLPLPVKLAKLIVKIIGKEDAFLRLTGSLQVNISDAHDLLGWTPPYSIQSGLMKTVEAYNNSKT